MPPQNRATNYDCAHTLLCSAIRSGYPFFEPSTPYKHDENDDDDDDKGDDEDDDDKDDEDDDDSGSDQQD